MTGRDELYAYATVAFKDYEVPDIVRKHVDRLIDAHRAEVLAEAAGWLVARYGVTNRAAADLRRLAETTAPVRLRDLPPGEFGDLVRKKTTAHTDATTPKEQPRAADA